MPSDAGKCKVCESPDLEEIPEFRRLPRVTSDCVPFRSGGRLLICAACSAAQSPSDQQWFDEIGEIYRAYRSFQQYGGPEQHVLDAATGNLRRRSEVLLDRLSALPDFPQQGTVLDVGCGGGATLRAFSERSTWRLFGHEIDGRDLPRLRSIPRFEELFTCALEEVPRQFDAVTMVHSLEHFPDPVSALRGLRPKIAPGGRLFVQVPDAAASPLEYLVADHMLHFTSASLSLLADRAGFAVESLSTLWINKELSMTASHTNGAARLPARTGANGCIGAVRAQVDWLVRMVEAAHSDASGSASFGLFGSTIAASWLCGVLGNSVSFFVEEDVNRVGRTHMDRPILNPAEVPPGSLVFMPLIPKIACQVASRLGAVVPGLRLPPDGI